MSANLPISAQAGRRLVQSACPYFQSLIWSLDPIDTPGLGTYGVDKFARLYVDVDAVKDKTPGWHAFVLLHEMVHLINHHMDRCEDNIASDLAANTLLEGVLDAANNKLRSKGMVNDQTASRLEIKMPEEALLPEKFGLPPKLLVEQYNAMLPKIKIKIKKSKGFSHGDCGSCADGKKRAHEAPDPKDGGSKGMSKNTLDIKIRQVALAIREEAEKNQGSVPAGLEVWAGQILKPPYIPWQVYLSGAVRNAVAWAMGVDQPSWRKPSRRSTKQILFPGYQRPIPVFALVLDTSGSMSTKNLDDAVGLAESVLKTFGAIAYKLDTDAAVHVTKQVSTMRGQKLKGGGGTDMSLGIRTAIECKPKPQVVLVFTDGYTDWPNEQIGNTKVIAVLVSDKCVEPPGWITSIRIPEKQDQPQE